MPIGGSRKQAPDSCGRRRANHLLPSSSGVPEEVCADSVGWSSPGSLDPSHAWDRPNLFKALNPTQASAAAMQATRRTMPEPSATAAVAGLTRVRAPALTAAAVPVAAVPVVPVAPLTVVPAGAAVRVAAHPTPARARKGRH